MSEIIITESNIEKCLEKASENLNIPKENLIYNIIEEKKVFFKKEITISVSYEDISQNNEENNEDALDGKVMVCDGVIKVKDPDKTGKPAIVHISKLLEVNLDGVIVRDKFSVYENSKIDVSFPNIESSRNIKIETSSDKMKAYISIEYIPHNVYRLKNTDQKSEIHLETEIIKQEFPKGYTIEEVKAELTKEGIVYGIIENNILKCTNNTNNISNLFIAQGQDVINDEDDRIELKVEAENKIGRLKEDNNGRIDFKSIGFVKSVKCDEEIAAFCKGSVGNDGKEITGKVKKKKNGKKIKLRIGEGCILNKNNVIVACIDGKPCVKNNTICVVKLHEISGNINLSTGNIKFIGDILISGNVESGMKVEAGNSIQIEKNVESAEIMAKGNITIKQNVIESKITAGGEDVTNLRLLNNLELIENSLKLMYETVYEIKEHDLLGEKTTDGEIIKVLIENKFKMIPKTFFIMLKDFDLDDEIQSELVNKIRSKLFGLGPLSIKHYSELEDIIESIKINKKELKESLAMPVNVNLSYCQDCDVLSSGNIIIKGNGDYVSRLTANDSIIFDSPGSIARGGIIKAKNEIKCKSVGSSGGVITKLIVDSNGHIWADSAFQNTCFVIGERQYNLEKPSKNIHVYIDEKDELVVDKLLL